MRNNKPSCLDYALAAIVIVYGIAYLIDWLCGGCLQ